MTLYEDWNKEIWKREDCGLHYPTIKLVVFAYQIVPHYFLHNNIAFHDKNTKKKSHVISVNPWYYVQNIFT